MLVFDAPKPVPVSEVSAFVKRVLTHRDTAQLSQLLELSNHKSVSVRRLIAAGIHNLLPVEHLEFFRTWQAKEPDRQTFLSLQSLITRIEGGNLQQQNTSATLYSVSEVIHLLKQSVGAIEYTIEAELGQINQPPGGYVTYITLKEGEVDSISGLLTQTVLYRSRLVLNEGLKVRVTGRFKIGKQSRLYLDVESIELTGEGELLKNFLELKEKLTTEGIFDPLRKRPIPRFPRKIVLLASSNSAALTDVTKVLSQRRGGLAITHIPIKTQGVGAEDTILQALEYIKTHATSSGWEAVLMSRGGGSAEDLYVFNSERIVRALYGIPIPTVVAIGHERDTTLSELVADLRCSTPSQAAEKVSISYSELASSADALFESIHYSVTNKLENYRQASHQLAGWIMQYSVNTVSSLKTSSTHSLTQITSLLRNRYVEYLHTTQAMYEVIESANPHKILVRGYGLLTRNSEVISSVHSVFEGDLLTLTLADGELQITKA